MPVDDDVDAIRRAYWIASEAETMPVARSGVDVECERIFGLGKAGVEPVLDHRLGAADALLGGLDDEHDGARPAVLHRRQLLRGADHRGDVNVVAAGVHDRRLDPVDPDLADLRGIRQAALLLDRQAVHVGADQDGRPGPVAHHPDDAGPADALGDLDPADGAKPLGHDRGRARLLERQFGVLVEIDEQGLRARGRNRP